MLGLIAGLLLAAQVASAGYEHNLVYRSPYKNSPVFAIDVPLGEYLFHIARAQLILTMRNRQQEEGQRLARRQIGSIGLGQQQVAPGAGGRQKAANYLLYGDAAIDWHASDFIYSGSLNFTSGVASGDPYDYSVLIWTRAVPTGTATRDVPACVTYEVTDGENLTGNKIASGFAYTSYDVDNTVKIEVTGLSAQTYYWYQFANCAKPEEKSVIGRTKTAPGKLAQNVGTQRFSVYSCSNYPNGFFNSYGGPYYNNDTDYVIHLGDYIYEAGNNKSGASINRTVLPEHEIFSLEDYRQRYQTYRQDPDLLLNHQHFPWIAVWDDHETANNDWKAGTDNSNDTSAGCLKGGICFTEREANAKRAYHEYIPIREVDVSDEKRIWRDFRFGDLGASYTGTCESRSYLSVDIVALDTRKYDRDVTDNSYNTEYVSDLAIMLNSSRSLTGEVQEKWMLDTLDASHQRGTKWRLVMNQIIFGTVAEAYTSAIPATSDFPIDYDAWDGYQAQRQRIMQHAYDADWNNTVFVAGDSHANWLYENRLDNILIGSKDPSTLTPVDVTKAPPRRGTLIEFGGTAVSSSGWGSSYRSSENATAVAGNNLVANTAGLLWAEGYIRGYMHVAISPSDVTTSYYGYIDNQTRRTQNRTLSARFSVRSGTNAITRPLTATYGALKKPPSS